jgi:hypothetical protein
MTSARERLIRIGLIAMGLFTAVPVLAVADPGQLESAYQVRIPEPMVLTLLQHRGVLQMLAGAALVWAAIRPDVRVPVTLGVAVAKTSALLLTVTRPEAQALANPGVQTFDAASVVVLIALAGAAVRRRDGTSARASA